MALFSVQDETDPQPSQPSPKSCQFEDEQGHKCGLTKILARNYCARHYRQLERSGVFRQLEQRPSESDLVQHNLERLAKARSILERAAPRLARNLIKSAQIAAEKGDHKPALAGLLHAKAIDPIAQSYQTSPNSNQQSGVVIKIGVALSGQTSTATSPREITLSNDDAVVDGAITNDTKADNLLAPVDNQQDDH